MSSDLIAYGCVATIPGPATFLQRVRRELYSVRDRLDFKNGRLDRLDYRNHEDAATYNLGDHAIMVACLDVISKVSPGARVASVNWMGLDALSQPKSPIVVCGSGYFILDEQHRISSRLTADSAFSEKHDLPIIVYGAGVNAPDAALRRDELKLKSTDQAILCRLLKRCTHIGVRDDASRQLLQAYTDLPVEMIGDPAFYIKASHTNADHVAGGVRPLIGLNFPFHGVAVNRRLNNDLLLYIDTLKKIQRATGCLFQYMIHYDAEIIVAKLLRDAGLELSIIRGDVNNLLMGYSRLNVHMGGMLHSCILAASTGTPCVGLSYDIKHAGFFDVLELPDLCVPTQPWPAELIVETVLDTLSREKELRAHISRRREVLEARAFAFLQKAIAEVAHGS